VAVDVNTLVHAKLAAMAERCYPPAARRFQQRGTVELSFCLDATGATASSQVTKSSGADLLDAAARGCVLEGAAPFTPDAASRCYTVPVRFGAR
jgi:TonB family protein